MLCKRGRAKQLQQQCQAIPLRFTDGRGAIPYPARTATQQDWLAIFAVRGRRTIPFLRIAYQLLVLCENLGQLASVVTEGCAVVRCPWGGTGRIEARTAGLGCR